MIDIKELRIGNWIMTKHPANENRNEMITKWQVYASDFEQINESPCPEVYYPIPLTAEIFEKCGFEAIKADVYGKETQHIIYRLELTYGLPLVWDGKNIIIETGDVYYSIELNIKNLHQLQNLFFALTGKEIEIKL